MLYSLEGISNKPLALQDVLENQDAGSSQSSCLNVRPDPGTVNKPLALQDVLENQDAGSSQSSCLNVRPDPGTVS
jgi:hypothetical protein